MIKYNKRACHAFPRKAKNSLRKCGSSYNTPSHYVNHNCWDLGVSWSPCLSIINHFFYMLHKHAREFISPNNFAKNFDLILHFLGGGYEHNFLLLFKHENLMCYFFFLFFLYILFFLNTCGTSSCIKKNERLDVWKKSNCSPRIQTWSWSELFKRRFLYFESKKQREINLNTFFEMLIPLIMYTYRLN